MSSKKASKRPAERSGKKGGDSKKKPRAGSSAPGDHKRQRRHADVVEQAKSIWNKLRLKTNTAKENRDLMDELIPLIEGKANQIALQHDASRVVQAAIQFGTEKERRAIWKELCVDSAVLELCKSQYANFVVLKVIKYCHNDEECVNLLIKAFKGNMTRLAVHAVASRVIEALFTTLTPKQTAVLKQEFYGPHFSLFAADLVQEGPPPTLESNLASAPDKRDKTMDFVRNLVNKCMEKSLYGYTYFQELLAEYIDVAGATEVRSLASVAADNVVHLISTRAGTRAAASLVTYGTAKDRKRIMKSLKGYSRSGLLHHDAYLAILRLVQLTDDTVSVQKNLLNELLTNPNADDSSPSPLLEIALSGSASKLFSMVLVDGMESWKKCFDPYEHSVLTPNPMIEEGGKEVPTSKKDDSQRRKELKKHLREPLIELCTQHTEELLRSWSGSRVLREVYTAFHPEELVGAVIKVCRDALDNPDDGEGDNLFEDFTGHLAVKNLFLEDSSEKAQEAPFAEAFLDAFGSQLMDIAKSNRGAFVVAALCKVSSVRKKVAQNINSDKLKKHVKNDKGPTAGFKALMNEIK